MKAWEKHQVDLYLLANDILENLYYQQHGYKSVFYYDFNQSLNFLQSDGSRRSQLKLLGQLADKDVLTYEVKAPSEYTTDQMISRNVDSRDMHKELIHLRVNPHVFNEVYAELLKHQPGQATAQQNQTVYLAKPDNRLLLRVGSEEYTLNEFRPELPPDRIFTSLINRWPNTKVTRTMLEIDAGIKTSRPLNQIANKSLKPFARKIFVTVRTPDALLVRTEVIVERSELELLLSEID